MPTIRAFNAIKPHAYRSSEVLETASLKARLEQPVVAWEHPQVNDLYDNVVENLEILLRDGILERSSTESLYIYQVLDQEDTYTGVWTLTFLDDLISGRIKTHELTLKADEDKLKNYRAQTKLEGSPVLITYEFDEVLDGLIKIIQRFKHPFVVRADRKEHYIWKVDEPHLVSSFTEAFSRLGTVYLADGHHRTAAARLMTAGQHGDQRPAQDDPASYFSTLYVPANQLQVRDYFRLLTPETPIEAESLLDIVRQHFELLPSSGNSPLRPVAFHEFGMCFSGNWYLLKAKPTLLNSATLTDLLDVTLLHRYILEPAFQVTDARSDKRLTCIGGRNALPELISRMKEDARSIGFTLCPPTVNQLMSVAYTNGVMPPKSTWIEPKIPFGLLMYYFG